MNNQINAKYKKQGSIGINMLKKAVKTLEHARACAYFEAYRLRREKAPDDVITPMFWLGLFDAPILVAFSTYAAWAISFENGMEAFIPNSVILSSESEIIGATILFLYVASVEYVYFSYVNDCREIIEKFESLSEEALRSVRRVAILYAFTGIVGGTIASVLLRRYIAE